MVCDDELWPFDDTLLVSVFSYLGLVDRCACTAVSQHTSVLINQQQPRVIRLCNTPPHIAKNVVEWAVKRSPQLAGIDLHGFPGPDINSIVGELRKCSKLEVLSLQHCGYFSGDSLRMLPNSLRELSLWDSGASCISLDEEGNESDDGYLLKSDLLELFRRCVHLENLDLRGQRAVDDDVLVEGLCSLQKLRKVALAGTQVSPAGCAALLRQHGTTMVRAGFGCLRTGQGNLQGCNILRSSGLKELAVTFSQAEVVVDLDAMPQLEVLNLDGIGWRGFQRIQPSWRSLRSTSIQQILVNNSMLPVNFFEILQPLAPQLKHLGFVASVYETGRPPASSGIDGFLGACQRLQQVGLSRPGIAELRALAQLPDLRILTLDQPDADVLYEFVASVIPDCRMPNSSLPVPVIHPNPAVPVIPDLDRVFPLLEELVISNVALNEFPMFLRLCHFVHAVPSLCSLAFSRTRSLRGDEDLQQRLLAMLQALRMPHSLKRLSVERGDFNELARSVDAAGFATSIADAAPNLDSLILPPAILRAPGFVDQAVEKMLKLRVLGCSVTESPRGFQVFGGWMEHQGRWLRHYDPYGYEEACVKPANSFLNLLEFDLDPALGTMEP